MAVTRSYSWRLTSRARALSIRASIMASSRIMAAGPAATGTRRLAGPRREAQDELGCGERVARPSGAPVGSICAALREAPQARDHLKKHPIEEIWRTHGIRGRNYTLTH